MASTKSNSNGQESASELSVNLVGDAGPRSNVRKHLYYPHRNQGKDSHFFQVLTFFRAVFIGKKTRILFSTVKDSDQTSKIEAICQPRFIVQTRCCSRTVTIHALKTPCKIDLESRNLVCSLYLAKSDQDQRNGKVNNNKIKSWINNT